MNMFILRRLAVAGCGVAVLVLAGSAQANLASNGGFEESSSGAGELGTATTATGWAAAGFNLLFADPTAEIDTVSFWGADNGGSGTLSASPDGGNFVAASADYEVGAISQTIAGLTVGDEYQLTFDYAGAQQHGFDGATTTHWDASLGGKPLTQRRWPI